MLDVWWILVILKLLVVFGPARHRQVNAQKCPGQCLSRSKTAKMGSKMPPRRLQDGQDGFQDGSKMSPRLSRWHQESPRRPKRPQEDPKRLPICPKRLPGSPKEAPRCPTTASKMPQNCPREASHEIPTNIQETSDPQPRHGGGMGRRPLDPPPPVDLSQGCLAC